MTFKTFAAPLAVLLTLSTPVLADGSYVFIEQFGARHEIGASQSGRFQRLTVYQEGWGNSAITSQDGRRNTTVVGQSGHRNSATMTQSGACNIAGVAQFGGHHTAETTQEGGCNAVATTYGVLGMVARKWAHKIPLVLKFNHNELLSAPQTYRQIKFAEMEKAWDMGCVAVGATVYFGSEDSNRQIIEVSEAFARAHELGMATILWAYLRNDAFKKDGTDYHASADLTGQANHLAVTMEADIVKQKMATNNGGYAALNMGSSSYGKFDDRIYTELSSPHPIDLVRYQVANCYMGRIGLINSGGASGANDLAQAVRTAVVNKRGGGIGLISGRKAFQKSRAEGVKLLNAIQDVYLNDGITIA